MEGLATPVQLAEYLNVKVRTLDNWAWKGVGPPYITVEGSRRYDWAQIKVWLAERTVTHR